MQKTIRAKEQVETSMSRKTGLHLQLHDVLNKKQATIRSLQDFIDLMKKGNEDDE